MDVWFFQVWFINGGAKTPLAKEDIGKFYSGDCYIILYTYHSGDRKEDYFLCCWFGKDSIEVIHYPERFSKARLIFLFKCGLYILEGISPS